jgi:hypothetical protein
MLASDLGEVPLALVNPEKSLIATMQTTAVDRGWHRQSDDRTDAFFGGMDSL